jgi:anti-sigma regulatory factor (Ser/Thr protein kinase)
MTALVPDPLPAPLVLDATAAAAARLPDAVAAYATAGGVAAPVRERVARAVRRACETARVHAERGDGVPGGLRLAARLDGPRLLVSVADDGRGLGPRLDAPGLDVGLPELSALAGGVEVRGGGTGAGTEIRMAFGLGC